METKHAPDEQLEAPDPKRQKLDETPQPLISEEQKYWTSISEPPDIDYRMIIEGDKDTLKHLLADRRLPQA